MTRMVQCVKLGREAEGLEAPTYPGELGQRIYENVSRQAWQQWLAHQTMIINEYGLSTADPRSIELIEQHMVGFLFGEGDGGGKPQGFQPPGAKK